MLFMSPERLQNEDYNYKCDVWALGSIYFNIMTGYPPFNASSKEEFTKFIKNGDVKFPENPNLSL